MHLAITHDTRYDYAQAVHHAQHIAYLQPRPTVCQQVVAHQLHVNPHRSRWRTARTAMAMRASTWSLHRTHTRSCVVARSQVTPVYRHPLHSQLAWETARAQLAWAGTPWDPAAEFVLPSPHAPWHADFAAFAQPCFTPGVPLLQGVRALMRHLQSELRYESQSTEVHTPALQALAQRKGVPGLCPHHGCQPARPGLAARYVSGYLLRRHRRASLRCWAAMPRTPGCRYTCLTCPLQRTPHALVGFRPHQPARRLRHTGRRLCHGSPGARLRRRGTAARRDPGAGAYATGGRHGDGAARAWVTTGFPPETFP